MNELLQHLNVYEFETVLPGSEEKVIYKGLSTNSIKKLLVYENETDPLMEERILDSFIKLAVVSDNFNIDNMYDLDRYYLFIKIREATKGSILEYTHKCSDCGKEMPRSIDLNDLVVNKPEKFNDKLKLGNLTFTMSYPLRKTKKEVLKLINKKMSNNEKRVEIGLVDIASYITEIESPDGKIEIKHKDLIDYIGELPENEMEKINQWREDNDFGIRLIDKFECRECGKEESRSLPLTNFFG